MDKVTLERLELRASIIKALAHPSRLFMVQELAAGELCLCDLTEKIGADQSTVSKHMSILKDAGLVNARKAGTSIFYSLKVPCVLGFLECVESVLQARKDNLDRIECICDKKGR